MLSRNVVADNVFGLSKVFILQIFQLGFLRSNNSCTGLKYSCPVYIHYCSKHTETCVMASELMLDVCPALLEHLF